MMHHNIGVISGSRPTRGKIFAVFFFLTQWKTAFDNEEEGYKMCERHVKDQASFPLHLFPRFPTSLQKYITFLCTWTMAEVEHVFAHQPPGLICI